MKKGRFLLVFLPTLLWGITGREIMQKNDALPKAKTSRIESALVILKQGRREIKTFISYTKRRPKKETRIRMKFLKPTRIEFLSYSYPGKDSLQWIKLSSGRVRRIASSEKSSPFVNSHFYYEDIGEKYLDDYTYKYLGDTKIQGEDCYMVEARKKRGEKVYSKTISYVRKKDYVILRVDFYEKGRLSKILRNEKIEKIKGIYTPRKVVMERADKKGKSILYLRKVEYNISLPDSLFRKESF